MNAKTLKPITNKLLWIFAVGQFGWSLLSGIVSNWMVYYYTGSPDAQNPNTGIFASGMVGGLLGFLMYNFNPAKCFMGDTGSLFLGGAVAALAFAYDMPLILITLGFIFIIETLSDIIQVSYFKLTHGKRVFKMAPFHHHLEMGGWTGKKWKEKELFALFTGISLVMAIISFIGVYMRYA